MAQKEILNELHDLEQEISMLQTALEEKQRQYEQLQQTLMEFNKEEE